MDKNAFLQLTSQISNVSQLSGRSNQSRKYTLPGMQNSLPDQTSTPKSVDNANLKSKMSSTTRDRSTNYNFGFQLNPVGLKSGAAPSKYQPRNYNDILNDSIARS